MNKIDANMINYTATYTNQYQLTIPHMYVLKGQKDNQTVSDYYFCKLPFDAGYTVFAGMEEIDSKIHKS